MNILIYVMTILMLLTALTYARMEGFRSTAGIEAGFVAYMERQGRKPISDVAEIWYESIVINKRGKNEKPKDPSREVIKANSRLSFHLFLNSGDRMSNRDAYQQTRELTIRLMTSLYEEQDFFKDLKNKRANFLNEILDEIEQAADSLPDEIKITRATRLSKLEFKDKELEYAFYLMLRGLPKLESRPVDPSEAAEDLEEVLDDQDDPVIAEESQEDHATPGYVSLLDYITVRPYTKLRVYLASVPLLKVIYENDDTVGKVQELRQELFSQIKKEKSKVAASQEFQAAFAAQGNAQAFANILEFSVTNVDPRSYE